MSVARKYPLGDVKLLWGLAAARCAFPGCRALCVEKATATDPTATVGVIAHIVAHGDTGPRANTTMLMAERDSYANWVLLCDTHGRKVDVQPRAYPAGDMQKWKADHEQWVAEKLAQEMPEVTFAELEIVVQALLGAPAPPTTDLAVLDPSEKMKKNGLTARLSFSLTMGLGKAREVKEFVQHVAQRDSTFPERLKTGFLEEYRRLQGEGVTGDALFESLHQFAGGNRRAFREQAAGLAVLAYLFEACEVFER